MRDFEIGGFVTSLAGHDKGSLFIIIGVEDEYVILADGMLRTIEKPKRKKKKHVQYRKDKYKDLIATQVLSGKLTNEQIKYEIKQFQKGQS